MEIRKTLSENDVGMTGSHQAGILLPKTEDVQRFVPELTSSEKNPRLELAFTDPNRRVWNFTVIYYNGIHFGGTRNEFRLTGITGFIRTYNLLAGDVLILNREEGGVSSVNFEKSQLALPLAQITNPILENTPLSILHDNRVNCVSVLLEMKARDYLTIAEEPYRDQGGIEGQREPLLTTTAKRIRRTLVDDLRRGAVMPPLVIGALVDEDQLKALKAKDFAVLQRILNTRSGISFSIIDGMQRTTALWELPSAEINERRLRVEFWFASSTRSLVYRMLVLNTGQVPWTLRRQVEVVYQPLIAEIAGEVSDINLISLESGRRSRAGDFKASDVVELFLAFGSRKERIDTRERLAEEFTRLDLIEATSDSVFTSAFTNTLTYLAKLDKAFDKATVSTDEQEPNKRFRAGQDLFASQPACIGFATAISVAIFGRPGITRSPEEQQRAQDKVIDDLDNLLDRLNSMSADQVLAFLDFPILNEILSGRKAGKVGDFEREFFARAFQVLIDQGCRVDSLTSSWRAY